MYNGSMDIKYLTESENLNILENINLVDIGNAPYRPNDHKIFIEKYKGNIFKLLKYYNTVGVGE